MATTAEILFCVLGARLVFVFVITAGIDFFEKLILKTSHYMSSAMSVGAD